MDPLSTGLFPQVVHVQTPTMPDQERGDVFIFPSGTVVAWNVPDKTALRLVQQILPPASVNSHSGYVEVEKEDLEYIEDSTKDRSEIVGDTIVIGTQASKEWESAERSQETDGPSQAAEVDTILAKIAFSSGLARSTKLAVLERLTDTYFESTRSIPLILSRGSALPLTKPKVLRRIFEMLGFGSRLPFNRSFILRKTGELLSIRAQLNLYSELTDSLPDIFWDSRHELGARGVLRPCGKVAGRWGAHQGVEREDGLCARNCERFTRDSQ